MGKDAIKFGKLAQFALQVSIWQGFRTLAAQFSEEIVQS